MTTITLPRAAVEQALEALVWEAGSEPALYAAQTYKAIADLRAALAQQDEPVEYDRAAIAKAEGEQA